MVKISISTFGLLALATQIAAQAPVKIMPFGASIVGAPGCWRAVLYKKLQDSGDPILKNTDFVGSNKAPSCGFPYDGENEGHSGFLATGIVEKNQLPGWLSAAKPDVILMHLGTNDVIQKKSVQQILNAYATLVKQMRESNGKMKIIVSTLIPIKPGMFGDSDKRIVELNNAIPGWATTNTTTESPITVVDNFTGFNPATDTTDGEHPNTQGDQKLAGKFYPALEKGIKEVASPTIVQTAANFLLNGGAREVFA